MSNELFDLYDRNGVVFIPATIYSYESLGFYSGNTVFLQPPSVNGTYKPAYNTWLMLAINEKSKYKEEAWKFIKFLISKDMQSQEALNGFSVNKEAEATRRKNILSSIKSGEMYGFTGRRILPMTETVIDTADKLFSIAGFMPDNNQTISLIVLEEANVFFSGKESAEAAAKVIQNKINTYLNE